MQDFSSYLQVHSGPCRCPFRSVPVSIPVHAGVHSGPFRCPFRSMSVSIPVSISVHSRIHSGPFSSVPVSIPVHSTVHSGPFRCPFRSVPVHSCISMHPRKALAIFAQICIKICHAVSKHVPKLNDQYLHARLTFSRH